MKIHIPVLVVLCFLFDFPQKNESDFKNMYAIAMENHINELKEQSNPFFIIHEIQIFKFISDDVPAHYLPKNLKGHKIKYIDISDKKNKSALKRGFKVISIKPIRHSSNTITIDLTDFWVRDNDKKLDFGNRGGSTSVFEFSPGDNKWHHKHTKYSGRY